MLLTNCKEQFEKLRLKIKEEEQRDNLAGAKKNPLVRKCHLEKDQYIIPEIEIPKTLSSESSEEEAEEEQEEMEIEDILEAESAKDPTPPITKPETPLKVEPPLMSWEKPKIAPIDKFRNAV